jgi:CHAD domain-containing protein
MKMQPEKMPALVTLGDFAHMAIAKHFQKSIKHERDVLKDIDPEPLHQMRVGLRRLRTALQVFAEVIEWPKGSSVQNIGKIARCLGTVRDWDVMMANLGDQQLPLPKTEQTTLAKILNSTAKQRQQDFGELEKIIATHYKTFKQSLTTWVEQPSYQPIAQLPMLTALPDLLLPLISQLLLHSAWLSGVEPATGAIAVATQPEPLGQFLHQHGAALHDLRKQIKRVRYQTEFFVDYYDDAYETQVIAFKLLQETLGTLQDCTVLQDYLTRHLKASPQKVLPTLMAHLDQTAHTAFTQWQALQMEYLQPDIRARLRSLVLVPQFRAVPYSEFSNCVKIS